VTGFLEVFIDWNAERVTMTLDQSLAQRINYELQIEFIPPKYTPAFPAPGSRKTWKIRMWSLQLFTRGRDVTISAFKF